MSVSVRTSRDRVDVGVTLPRCRYIDRCMYNITNRVSHFQIKFSHSFAPHQPVGQLLAFVTNLPSATVQAMEASSSPPALAPVAATRYARPADLFVPSKLTSWVWQHFLQSRSHPDHAWCNVPGCPPSAQKVSRKKGNTSNMIEHLLKRHIIREPSRSSSSVSPASIREYLSSATTAAPCSASFRSSLDTHIAQFFISSCLPFNLADNPSFIASYHIATGGSYLPPS